MLFLQVFGLLTRNRRSALATGIPTVSVSVFELNLAYYVFTSSRLFRRLLKVAPFLAQWSKYTRQSWRWDAKAKLHDKLGGVFAIVSPRKFNLEVADYSVVQQILSNREGFKKPLWMFDLVNIYGENVVTTEDAKWVRHRRFTGPAFGEKNNNVVWNETIIQTEAMVRSWKNVNNDTKYYSLKDVGDDLRKLALLVISAAGYGMRIPFNSDESEEEAPEQPFDPSMPSTDAHLSYFASIRTVTHRFIDILVLRRVWPFSLRSISPPSVRIALDAYTDLGNYLRKLIRYHQSTPRNTDERKASLIQTLAQGETGSTLDSRRSLTIDEILGNAFIFTVAGHETTAVTLDFSLLLLAIYPEKQSWLHQQLDSTLRELPKDPREWNYHELFGKLSAPFCIMNETLRLYPPVIIIPRETSDDKQSLTIDGNCHYLPSKVLITLNTAALHYNRQYWGEDAEEFRPERWIRGDSNPLSRVDLGSVAGYPNTYTPPKGMFMPFSDGVRGCLGKKFAQVEFVAAITILMKDHTIEIEPSAGESEQSVRGKALQVLKESHLDATLMLPRSVPLRLKERAV